MRTGTGVSDEEMSTLKRFAVPVPKTGTVGALKEKLGELAAIDRRLLLVADVFRGR
jgi:hypothetical protein